VGAELRVLHERSHALIEPQGIFAAELSPQEQVRELVLHDLAKSSQIAD
jgi:hypothetical protein